MVQQPFAIGQGLQVDVLAQSRAQYPFAGGGRQIVMVAASGMIAVGVGDNRTLDRPPRVDIEITGGAIQAFRARDDKVHVAVQVQGLVS